MELVKNLDKELDKMFPTLKLHSVNQQVKKNLKK